MENWPGSTSTVEYTLTVPTRYSGGRVFLSYPRLSDEAAENLATPVFHIRPGWGDATTMVKVDGKRVSRDAPIVLGPVVEPAWMRELLEARDRTKGPATFAPDGLYFCGADYDASFGLPATRREVRFA